jgi:hypothetical protein
LQPDASSMLSDSDEDSAETVQDIQMVDELGFLQGMWITQQRSDLRDIMRNVENPDLVTLRRAGMIKVRLVQSVRMKKQSQISVSSLSGCKYDA